MTLSGKAVPLQQEGVARAWPGDKACCVGVARERREGHGQRDGSFCLFYFFLNWVRNPLLLQNYTYQQIDRFP